MDLNASLFGLNETNWVDYLGREMVVEALIKHGSNVNTKNKFGSTPLQQASFLGNFHKLIEEIMQLDRCDWNNFVCLGHEDIVELLLKNKADVNARRNDGWTALHISTHAGNFHKFITSLLKLDRCNWNGSVFQVTKILLRLSWKIEPMWMRDKAMGGLRWIGLLSKAILKD